ncbi:MAG: Fur family transcriptional regulator [Acidimicrobiales bacterium]
MGTITTSDPAGESPTGKLLAEIYARRHATPALLPVPVTRRAGHDERSGGAGERSTRQKRALTTVLGASDSFRSAQDLFTELREQGQRVGLTTVYNQLRALADAGQIDVMRSPEGETLYRRCDTDDHHHHLVCRECGHTVEIEGPEVEAWAERVAGRHGFTDLTHTVEILGACAVCSSRRAAGAPGRP